MAQEDLGTKWAPRYVRLSDRLPATATNKVLKRVLRAERWHTADPLYQRVGRELRYVVMTADDAAALDAALDAAGTDRPV